MDSKDEELMEKELNPINWFDWETFRKAILDFQKSGKFNVRNTWNQISGELTDEHTLDFKNENGLIVCEGIYLLHPEIKSIADFSILIDVPKEEARKRAEQRDRGNRSEEHMERKRLIMETYDIPYFNAYRKDVDLIIKS